MEADGEDAKGWNEVKKLCLKGLCEELAVHLGFQWPLVEQGESKKAKTKSENPSTDVDMVEPQAMESELGKSLREFVEALDGPNLVKNVHEQYRWDWEAGEWSRIPGTFLVCLCFGLRQLAAAQAVKDGLETELGVKSGYKVQGRDAASDAPPVAAEGAAQQRKLLLYFDKTEWERKMRAENKQKGKGKGKDGKEKGKDKDKGKAGKASEKGKGGKSKNDKAKGKGKAKNL